jgi:hypothetical protein
VVIGRVSCCKRGDGVTHAIQCRRKSARGQSR